MIKAVYLKIFSLFICLSLCNMADGQELLCNVQVSAQKIQGSNREVFRNMQRDIYEFMNNTSWTNHVYSYSERIECNLLINITEQISADEFSGTIQVQLKRPVYNTTYSSTQINFVDNNFRFRYIEYQPFKFDPTTHRSSLVSVLAYYAYMILGFDYDSFSPLGGTEFFTMAEKVVTNAQNATEAGWKPYDGSRNRNRYWLVKNVLNKEYENVRIFNYKYYREGLDNMESKAVDARANIAESLKLLREVYRTRPDPFMYFLDLVISARSDELIHIFSGAFQEEKSRVVDILVEIDPSNTEEYRSILSSK